MYCEGKRLWQSQEKYPPPPPPDAYANLSIRQVLKFVLGNENIGKFNAKFTNKVKPRPVSVKEIREQHQIDLVYEKHGSRIRREYLLVHPICYGHILSITLASSFDDKKSSHVKKSCKRFTRFMVFQNVCKVTIEVNSKRK